jgi:hypothetical protein
MTKNLHYYRWIAIFILILTHVPGYLFSQITVNTISDLRALSPGAAETVNVLGYYVPGDGGEGSFIWQGNSTQIDNGGTTIRPNSTSSQGRWIRDMSGYNYYNVRWFGAIPGYRGIESNFQICINSARDNKVFRIYIPKGIYTVYTRAFTLDDTHNGIEIFGDNIVTSIDHNGRHFVNEYESTVIKRGDYAGDFHIIRLQKDPISLLENITLRNLAIDGNRYNQNKEVEYGHNLLLYVGGSIDANRPVRNILIKDIWTYNAIQNGIQNYFENVRYENIGTYENTNQGLGLNGASQGIIITNIKVYRNGYDNENVPMGYSGLNFSSGSDAELYHFEVFENSIGMKVESARRAVIKYGVFNNNSHLGFRIVRPNVHGLEFEMDEVEANGNGHAGILLLDPEAEGEIHGVYKVGKVSAKNNAGVGVAVYSDAEIDEIIAENNLGTYGNIEFRRGSLPNPADVGITVNRIISKNARTDGVHLRQNAIVTIHSGEVSGNGRYGVNLYGRTNLNIFNVKFGNPDDEIPFRQTAYEIYDPLNEARVRHSGLDFTHSKVETQNRVRVNDIDEIANISIFIEYKDKYYIEDLLLIEAYASAPTTSVRSIEFFANDNKIGESDNSPYGFTWQNSNVGEFSVYAIATFNDNSQKISNTIILTVHSRTQSQKIFLQPGWNTISTYVEPDVSAITYILDSIEGNLSMVNNIGGNVYWPSLDINEIENWNHLEGYQIYMENADTLIVSGMQMNPEETPIHLSQGWNLTAFILDQSFPIEFALSTIEDKIQLVTNNDGQIYWPDNGINSIVNMVPGQGYKIFTNNDVELIYPSVSVIAPKINDDNKLNQRTSETVAGPKRYVYDFSNTGVTSFLLVECDEFFYGDEVGVWTETGKLIGSGVVTHKKAAITIWGKNPLLPEENFGADTKDVLRLTLWSARDESEYPLKITAVHALGDANQILEQLVYEPNAILIADVQIENSVPQRYSLEQNFPNPFNPSTVIQYELPRDVSVTLDVFNLLGQKVKTLVNEDQKAGSYQVSFTSENLASGVYFYRLQAGNYSEVRKMILLH